MFGRQAQGRAPPSSFGNNTKLEINEPSVNGRRLSGVDFEKALREDATLMLKDSVDVEELGADISISYAVSPQSSPSKSPLKLPPMNIVPPTPSPERTRASVYRQTAFASSPDLASLLKSKSKQAPPPLPTSPNIQRSSPSSLSSIPKHTVRAKTSAFLGKLMGQGSIRERSKTDASMSIDYTPPPPVPPLPSALAPSPASSPIADAFTSPRFPEASSSKPLPPIMLSPVPKVPNDVPSGGMVNKHSRSPSPAASNKSKRRSMSVGDADLRALIAASAAMISTPLPPTEESSERGTGSRKRLLTDFQGRTEARSYPSSPVLKLSATHSLHKSSSDSDSPHTSPVTPARSSSLNASPTHGLVRPASSSNLNTTLRSRGTRLSVQGPRDPNRHRAHHRSTASSSEPSLVTNGEGALASPTLSGSRQDFSSGGSDLTSFPSSSSQSLTKSDESIGISSKGKKYAAKCFNEDEDFLAREKIAEWLGGHGAQNKVALHFYMEFFDFTNLRLDMAFRRLCAKLFLKGETQQVDRILEQFSQRYWTCNSSTVYGSSNIVHAVSYSLLLLNTDLHVAELSTRMSRSQFVRNTITAIQMQLDNPPLEKRASASELGHDSPNVGKSGSDSALDGTATIKSRSTRSDSMNSWNSVAKEAALSLRQPVRQSPSPGHHSNGSVISMQGSASGHDRSPAYGRSWEIEMEALLKEMYSAIKNQQILQPLTNGPARLSTSSLSTGPPPVMRNRSLRGPPDRLATLKRGSIRGLQSILGSQQGSSPYSSNSSIDGRVSPSPSFATSTHEALYASNSSFLTPTLGFASNLSHTIIRETQEDDEHRSVHTQESNSTTISISDEELALLGAPWAKEGMLCRKQYWEASSKRAKDKSWLDVFVVIQRGELNMFTFGEHGSAGRGIFGGGNWLANADPAGTIQLAHSLAHALPPPGYNRQRPHCMVLTLSNGGVYFFQAGTDELVNEWVSTCNYWAARTSKEPLAGGVSNMEYGWNRVSDPVHGRSQSDSESITEDPSDALSMKSGRSGRSRFGWKDGASTVRAPSSPWKDRVVINDWKPPMHPTVSSGHDEESQMEALQKHVATMKHDIKRHNELREPMLAVYSPRSNNALKAQGNWEKKSRYLLAEIVKYDSYVESLKAAMSLRLKKRGEKALERALCGTSPAVDGFRGDERTIHGDEEPLTLATNHTQR